MPVREKRLENLINGTQKHDRQGCFDGARQRCTNASAKEQECQERIGTGMQREPGCIFADVGPRPWNRPQDEDQQVESDCAPIALLAES